LDRTYVSVNLQNLITVPLMAALGFLVAAVVYQVLLSVFGSDDAASAPANGGGY
jgi:hypothetical protein